MKIKPPRKNKKNTYIYEKDNAYERECDYLDGVRASPFQNRDRFWGDTFKEKEWKDMFKERRKAKAQRLKMPEKEDQDLLHGFIVAIFLIVPLVAGFTRTYLGASVALVWGLIAFTILAAFIFGMKRELEEKTTRIKELEEETDFSNMVKET